MYCHLQEELHIRLCGGIMGCMPYSWDPSKAMSFAQATKSTIVLAPCGKIMVCTFLPNKVKSAARKHRAVGPM